MVRRFPSRLPKAPFRCGVSLAVRIVVSVVARVAVPVAERTAASATASATVATANPTDDAIVAQINGLAIVRPTEGASPPTGGWADLPTAEWAVGRIAVRTTARVSDSSDRRTLDSSFESLLLSGRFRIRAGVFGERRGQRHGQGGARGRSKPPGISTVIFRGGCWSNLL